MKSRAMAMAKAAGVVAETAATSARRRQMPEASSRRWPAHVVVVETSGQPAVVVLREYALAARFTQAFASTDPRRLDVVRSRGGNR